MLKSKRIVEKLFRSSHSNPTLNWVARNPGVLSEYEGQWVALDVDRVVGHADSMLEALRQARDNGVEDPFMMGVPDSKRGFR